MTVFPSGEAVAVTYDATVSSSTALTFNALTAVIEVTAIDKGIFMNWGTTSASTTVFDNFIAAGTSRRFVIPSNVLGATFIEEAASAHLVVIEK